MTNTQLEPLKLWPMQPTLPHHIYLTSIPIVLESDDSEECGS